VQAALFKDPVRTAL